MGIIQKSYFVRYNFVFAIGKNYHKVEIYSDYSKDNGLEGDPIYRLENSNKRILIRHLKKFCTKEQISVIESLARDRQDMIVSPVGSCRLV